MGMNNRIHEEQTQSSLPADLEQDYQRVSDWVRQIFRLHCDQVVVKIIDAASVEGFFKTLRYGVRHYPTVIVDSKSRFSGSALEEASQAIARRLEEKVPAPV
jgi:hypothetical protein